MDIGFDNNDWLPASPAQAIGPGCDSGCGSAPEWLELRARLGAAWSARRELAFGEGSNAGRNGSFDRISALALAGFEPASSAVNRIALGNLKSRRGNAGHHTGELTPGGRG